MIPQGEFPAFAVESVPPATLQKFDLIMRLLPNMTSLPVVSEFLKSKGVPHSAGSWEEMRDSRMTPYLKSHKITIGDLTRLLSEAEEFGRSHVFLYTAKKKDVEGYVEKEHIRSLCQKLGHTDILAEPLIVDLPTVPTLTEIREESVEGHTRWVFKIIEARREREFVSERTEGNRIIKEWLIKDIRAVNVARLHASGFLEVRIQSHLNSTKYQEDLHRILMALKDFLPPKVFTPFSLAKAKAQLWEQRGSLTKKVRFSDSTMTNSRGTTLVASTGAEEADLFEDTGATASIDQFLGHGAHCDSSNIWWRPVEGQTTREIHMLLSGLNNEFAITANCTKLEYECVLSELRVHSK
ncbi:MAG TPA: hypothetical protein VN829_17600 [Dongiaceae bacterium]|nr:hypothetical protein [Dongiaceae bacterium]